MKEPRLIKKIGISNLEIKKQRQIIIVTVLCVVTLFLTSSYALLTNFDKTDEVITFQTGNLEMTINDTSELITLSERVPESDEEGLKNASVIPIIMKNTGTIPISYYEISLISEDSETNVSTLDKSYIRYSISEDNESYTEAKSLSDSYIFKGYDLEVLETKTIYLKIWLTHKVPNDILGKTFYGAISVDLYQKNDEKINGVELIKNQYGIEQTLVAINTEGTLYNGTGEIREYRYSGATANNYVIFNDDLDDVIEANELWRIVGIFTDSYGEQHLKLVRDTILTTDELPNTYTYNGITYSIENQSSGTTYFNNSSNGDNNNNWTTSGLQYFLNTESDASGTAGYYATFNEKSRDLIEEKMIYYLGSYNSSSATSIISYTKERDEENIEGTNDATWTGGIGLLYPSDYGYTASNTYWNNTISSYKSAAYNTSWLQLTGNHNIGEWLISPLSGYTTATTNWLLDGSVDGSYSYHSAYGGVRPYLYLIKEAKFKENTEGTMENPYRVIESK